MSFIQKIYMFHKLRVQVYTERGEMGRDAAQETAGWIRAIAAEKGKVSVVFAAAPSQNEFLAALAAMRDIPWGQVHAFHMDEYIGLEADAPQGFANFLRTRLFNRLPFASVSCLDSQARNPEDECRRYTALLEASPPDIVCMGIGENGHIAFNDPHAAKFDDPERVKVVELDRACREQQVHDGCFSTLEQVPKYAITLTIPVLTRVSHIACIVPGSSKAEAVRNTLTGPVSETCPASILRRAPQAVLFLEPESAEFLH